MICAAVSLFLSRVSNSSVTARGILPGTDDRIRLTAPLRVIIRDYANTAPKNLEKAIARRPSQWRRVNYSDDFTGVWLCKEPFSTYENEISRMSRDPIANLWARVAYPR